MSGNIIQLNEQFIHNELKTIVKNSVEETLNALLDAEADKLVQAERYARDQTRKGYRAGHYERSFSTQAGDVTLKVPKLKGFTFESAIIQCYQRRWLSFGKLAFFTKDVSCLLENQPFLPKTLKPFQKQLFVL